MFSVRKSLNGESKTGLITCNAGGTIVAGNPVKITSGGTIVKSTVTGMETIVYKVIQAVNGDSDFFGIAQNSASSGETVEVIPVTKADILRAPYGIADSSFSNAVVPGTQYEVIIATSGARDTQLLVFYEASPTAGDCCVLVLSVDTTNGVCDCMKVK